MPANTDPMIIPYGRAVIDSRTDLNKNIWVYISESVNNYLAQESRYYDRLQK